MTTADDVVLQTVPLGLHWPTIDPFLFCAHHHDDYPAGDGELAPVGSLAGRSIGMDFEPTDGWRMYHGHRVPGFPQHPHRGFETVTYVREGFCDHADSLGATARFGEGDVQWLTTGAGIVHSEMFPLRSTEHGNPLELFQIWVNLPAVDKMADPCFSMLWAETIPRVRHVDDSGRATEVVVLAGAYREVLAPPPPPDSWASHPEADLAIWHLHLDPGAELVLPGARPGTVRTLYVFDGDGVELAGHRLDRDTGSVVRPDVEITLRSTGGADCLVLQGRPIGEPVVQQGPFVLADEAALRQAFADYQRTGFGGWPWPSDDPVHPANAGRFAVHPDGRHDDPAQRS